MIMMMMATMPMMLMKTNVDVIVPGIDGLMVVMSVMMTHHPLKYRRSSSLSGFS